jgi:predicted metal-dependent enzyme (double-stranded beta helix superfamily)
VIKFAYRPFGLLVSVLGGLLAGALFKQAWRLIAGEDDSPDAKDRDRGWGEIALAAAVEGAVFGAVKAVLDRAGAKGFERATGVWPGTTEDED